MIIIILINLIFIRYWINFKLLNWGITLIISMLSWIPFRVSSLDETFLLYSKLFNFDQFFNLSFRENTYIICFLILVIFLLGYFFRILLLPKIKVNTQFYFVYNFLKYIIIIFLTFIFLKPLNQFIYFQF